MLQFCTEPLILLSRLFLAVILLHHTDWTMDLFIMLLFIRNTVRCHYNAVNFLKNINKRHPIAGPLGLGMGCLLWIQHMIDILPQSLKSFMQYLPILNHVIMALDFLCCVYVYIWTRLTNIDDFIYTSVLWFNIKMPSYEYKDTHYKVEMVRRRS